MQKVSFLYNLIFLLNYMRLKKIYRDHKTGYIKWLFDIQSITMS